ncbi:hypothetical protein B0H14DRAFT_2610279 [Mycena olivaceomarginata]|nr:hypothetical protein B0H14DRAFT_2610279 [Mycena olivaceomarginata]
MEELMFVLNLEKIRPEAGYPCALKVVAYLKRYIPLKQIVTERQRGQSHKDRVTGWEGSRQVVVISGAGGLGCEVRVLPTVDKRCHVFRDHLAPLIIGLLGYQWHVNHNIMA